MFASEYDTCNIAVINVPRGLRGRTTRGNPLKAVLPINVHFIFIFHVLFIYFLLRI